MERVDIAFNDFVCALQLAFQDNLLKLPGSTSS